MKDDSLLSVAAVAGVMTAGGVIAAIAVNQAFAVSQMLDPVMVGREAAIMHLVLRGAIKNAALCGGLLLAFCRCWRGKGIWWRDLRPMALPLKMGVAVLAACSLGESLIRLSLCFVPVLILPVAALGGWRGLQLVDLAMQSGFTLLLYAFANWIQRKIESARSATSRVAFASFAVCLFVVLASPAPYWIVGKLQFGRHVETFDAEEEEKAFPRDDVRIDVDEPWEMISYSRPSFDGRREKEGKMKNVERTEMAERVTDAAALTGIGAAATGVTAAAVGVTTTVTTAGMSAAAVTGDGAAIGGTIGGITGGVVGAGVGIASGGNAIVGTIPLAAAGATTGAFVGGAVATTVAGWLGIPIATTTTVVTAPAWAIPGAVVGGMAAIGAIGYRLCRRCIVAKLQPILVDAHEIASCTGTVVVG